MMAAAFTLGWDLMGTHYDLVLNVGVCGSFREELRPGTLVNVREEFVADLGAEYGNEFRSVFETGLVDEDRFPFRNGKLTNPFGFKHDALDQLRQVRGVSVNTVSGNTDTIARLKRLYDPDIETMEGAGVFYACIFSEAPFACVRAVSNYVGELDRKSWKLKEAIHSLNDWVIPFVKHFVRA